MLFRDWFLSLISWYEASKMVKHRETSRMVWSVPGERGKWNFNLVRELYSRNLLYNTEPLVTTVYYTLNNLLRG